MNEGFENTSNADYLKRVRETIAELAALSADEYELIRTVRAKDLGMSLGALDKAVNKARRAKRREHDSASPQATSHTGPYGVSLKSGDEHLYRTSDEEEHRIRICNFAAGIDSVIDLDDGTGVPIRLYGITATFKGITHSFEVPADSFDDLGWMPIHLPPDAAAEGPKLKPHISFAIRHTSGNIEQKKAYGFTGWHKHQSQWVYLNPGTSIGPEGKVDNIRVLMGDSKLQKIGLPEPPTGEALQKTVRQHLVTMCNKLPFQLVVVGVGAVLSSFIDKTDSSVHFHGESGSYKTALAIILQRHVGPAICSAPTHSTDDLHSFFDSVKSLIKLGFRIKNGPFVVDEFSSAVLGQDVARTGRQFFQEKGNSSGRTTLTRTRELREAEELRATTITTGEELPVGFSGTARVLSVRVPSAQQPGAIDFESLKQVDAESRAGVHAMAMAAFIQYLAGRLDDIQKARPQVACQAGTHTRTAKAIADITYAWRVYVTFALEHGAITIEEFNNLMADVEGELADLVKTQRENQRNENPAELLISGVRELFAAKKAYVRHPSPEGRLNRIDALNFGWIADTDVIDPGRFATMIGWYSENDKAIFLLPQETLKLVQAHYGLSRHLGVSTHEEMTQRLSSNNWLMPADGRHLLAKLPGGDRSRCWKIARDKLWADDGDDTPDNVKEQTASTAFELH